MKRRYKVSIAGDFVLEAESPKKARDLIDAFIRAKEFDEKNFECGISLDKRQTTVPVVDVTLKKEVSVKEVIKKSKKVKKPTKK